MLGLKLNHVGKRGTWCHLSDLVDFFLPTSVLPPPQVIQYNLHDIIIFMWLSNVSKMHMKNMDKNIQ